jgi:hypothetical protein
LVSIAVDAAGLTKLLQAYGRVECGLYCGGTVAGAAHFPWHVDPQSTVEDSRIYWCSVEGKCGLVAQ